MKLSALWILPDEEKDKRLTDSDHDLAIGGCSSVARHGTSIERKAEVELSEWLASEKTRLTQNDCRLRIVDS